MLKKKIEKKLFQLYIVKNNRKNLNMLKEAITKTVYTQVVLDLMFMKQNI
jgi:hypothetical protein